MSEDDEFVIESKYDLTIALSSGTGTRKFRSMPSRPMTYEEIQSIANKYSKPDRDCEAWVIDLFDFGVGSVSMTMGGEELEDSESVTQFALLTDDNWMPFEFEQDGWYRKDGVPHPDDVDLDEEIENGSMQRVSDAMNDEE